MRPDSTADCLLPSLLPTADCLLPTGWTPSPPTWLLLTSAAMAVLIAGKHHDNFGRLLAGTEHRLGDADPEAEVA